MTMISDSGPRAFNAVAHCLRGVATVPTRPRLRHGLPQRGACFKPRPQQRECVAQAAQDLARAFSRTITPSGLATAEASAAAPRTPAEGCVPQAAAAAAGVRGASRVGPRPSA